MISKAAFLLVALTNILYVHCAPASYQGDTDEEFEVVLDLQPLRFPYQNSILKRLRRDNYGHHQGGPHNPDAHIAEGPHHPLNLDPIGHPHELQHIAEGSHHPLNLDPIGHPHPHEPEHIGENPHQTLPRSGFEPHHDGPIGHPQRADPHHPLPDSYRHEDRLEYSHDPKHIADDVAASTHELASEIKHAADSLEDTAHVVEGVADEVGHIASSEDHDKPDCYHRSILERIRHAFRRLTDPVLNIFRG